MKKLKHVLGLLLAVCVLAMSLPLSALAAAPAYSDTGGHWAEKVIEKWSEYDIVHGSNGQFRPNAAMTRGEFATVMSNLLGLEEHSENPFRDITGKEWYAKAVLQANAAGILLGNNNNANATADIQRQEAFVMVGRALGVVPEATASGALAGFADQGKVSGWAKPTVAALVKGGYVNGTSATTLAPNDKINRASVIQIVGNIVKTYITEPGSYTADKDGFVVVKAQGNVTVSGSNAGLVVGAGSKGANITVSSAQITGGAKVDAPNAVLTLDNTSIGGVVTVSSSAKNAKIVVPAGSTVDKIVTSADSVSVSGEGVVKTVVVASGDNVNVSTPGTNVIVDKPDGLISAHDSGDQTRLEAVPAANQTYTYDYVEQNEGQQPTKATATIKLDGDEFKGKPTGRLVGSDFNIQSDDGSTYYAMGMVKYVYDFDSYWFNHARDTFYYGVLEDDDEILPENVTMVQMKQTELIEQTAFEEWEKTHNNLASFGYYMVFDLAKGDLQTGGKIEITDTAVAGKRTITAADFGQNEKIPVVYQLKSKESPTQGSTPFANELTIRYYNDGSTESKSVTLKLEKEAGSGGEKRILYGQERTDMPIENMVPNTDTQKDMELMPLTFAGEKDPPQRYNLRGTILPDTNAEKPYNLTLNFRVPDPWPQFGNQPETTPDDAVIIRITPELNEPEGELFDPIEITKAQLLANPSCVIEGVRRFGFLHFEINLGGLNGRETATEACATQRFLVDLYYMDYPEA